MFSRTLFRSSSPRQAGFTLVELSIVLVIIGLLVGGVLSGQSLIHAAQLRAISTENDKYVTAMNTFRGKYFALPGDMTNASAFWGLDSSCGGSVSGACNGNGDGVITMASGANAPGESFQFWRHLALAGLIEGTYSGLAGPDGPRAAYVGINIPASKYGTASGVSFEYWGTQSGNGLLWNGTYNNIFIFGGQNVGAGPPEAPILKPEDAWNLDTKLDDGVPSTGKLRTFYRQSYVPSLPCTTTDVEATTQYNLAISTGVCNLAFITGY